MIEICRENAKLKVANRLFKNLNLHIKKSSIIKISRPQFFSNKKFNIQVTILKVEVIKKLIRHSKLK